MLLKEYQIKYQGEIQKLEHKLHPERNAFGSSLPDYCRGNEDDRHRNGTRTRGTGIKRKERRKKKKMWKKEN